MASGTNQSEKIRTFVAFDIPDAVTASIHEIQNTLKAKRLKVRWVRADNLHLTLKFLGAVSVDRMEAINQALELAAEKIPPLDLFARGLGVFPGVRRPRVIWVGINGDVETLMALQQAIDRHLASIGFAREKRSFKAHLTIGRVKGAINAKQLLEAIQLYQDYRSERFQVQRIELIRSDLKPQGPEYTSLATIALKESGGFHE